MPRGKIFLEKCAESAEKWGQPSQPSEGSHSRRYMKGKDLREEVERNGHGGEETRKVVYLGSKNKDFLGREFITTLCCRPGRFVFVDLV